MDRITFGDVILRNEQQFYRIAKAILRSDEDCADATQEAIARAFEKLSSLKKDEYAKTWFIRILIHECFRMLRRREREIPVEECREEAGGGEDYRDLYQGLSMLAPKYRVILVMHYLEGFQVSEIAAALGIAKGTVKSPLHRGRTKLREILEEME